jgi:hypothetical protein
MRNRFGAHLCRDDVRWAAAEGVSETVIAAVLLLNERSVEEIVAELTAFDLEQVIKLVGRSPRVYPPGTLDALKNRRALVSPGPPQRSGESAPIAAEKQRAGTPCAQHTVTRGADPRGQPSRGRPAKAGTPAGTRNETARRRLIVEDLIKAGLSIRMMAEVTRIPRSSVHRALRAVARAEAKKQVAIGEITAELLGKKLSHRRRGRA